MDTKLIIIGLLMSMLMLCNFNQNCLKENFLLGGPGFRHLNSNENCNPHMLNSIATQPTKQALIEKRAGIPHGASAVRNPQQNGAAHSAVPSQAMPPCAGNHRHSQLGGCGLPGYESADNFEGFTKREELEEELEELEEEVVHVERIVTALLKNRNQNGADFIRGDIPIKKCDQGWFNTHQKPHESLRIGALTHISDAQNPHATAQEVATHLAGDNHHLAVLDHHNQASLDTANGLSY